MYINADVNMYVWMYLQPWYERIFIGDRMRSNRFAYMFREQDHESFMLGSMSQGPCGPYRLTNNFSDLGEYTECQTNVISLHDSSYNRCVIFDCNVFRICFLPSIVDGDCCLLRSLARDMILLNGKARSNLWPWIGMVLLWSFDGVTFNLLRPRHSNQI